MTMVSGDPKLLCNLRPQFSSFDFLSNRISRFRVGRKILFCPASKTDPHALLEQNEPSFSRRGIIVMPVFSISFAPLFRVSEKFPANAMGIDAHKYIVIKDGIRKFLSKGKAPGVLRLVFHDAGTFDMRNNSGGMNGSIVYELDRPENSGLQKSLKVLLKAKDEIDKTQNVSWADLIAVAGAEAVFICGGPVIQVKLGRQDSRLPDPEGKLPEETLNISDLKKTFQDKGFSIQELVALSGAHTIGNKGFGNPIVFDNSYYKILMDKPWLRSDAMSAMIGLPTDRALMDDDECSRWIKVYADDQEKFFDDFKNVYIKLVNTGSLWEKV